MLRLHSPVSFCALGYVELDARLHGEPGEAPGAARRAAGDEEKARRQPRRGVEGARGAKTASGRAPLEVSRTEVLDELGVAGRAAVRPHTAREQDSRITG